MMNNYICGVKLKGDNPEAALKEAMFPTQSLLVQDTLFCIESPGIGVGFLSWTLPIAFMSFLLLGFGLGVSHKSNKVI